MKRTLSLVLALVMVLGTFTSVLAAPVTEVDAGAFLKEKGVLTGSLDGDLMLEDGMKRQDSVVMLSRLLDVEEDAKAFPTSEESPTWEDAQAADVFYLGYLAWGQANNYFEGHSAVRFGFDEEITIQQYLNVVLRALGYEVEYSEVMATAVEVGLIEEVVTDAVVTRGMMATLTMTALNTVMKDSTVTLAEKLEIEMPEGPVPATLEVDEVVADNLKEVKVMFNKDVDVDLEDAELFTIKGLTVEDAVLVDNALVLSVSKMVNNKAYKLVVKGTEEVDGTYDFKAYDNEVPYVVDVQALGTKAIKVILSEPVQKVTSTNFRLNGKTLYAGVPVNEGKEIIIRPYTELSLGEHDLTVKGLKDHNNFISLESNHKFEVAEDTDAPTVVDVSATLERVVVEFSEDVDPNTVNAKSVYWMEGSVKRYSNKATALAGNKFAFDFDSYALPVYETTLYVNGVKDYSGNEMTAAEVPVKAVIDETRPEVVSADLSADRESVTVKFNKSVKANKTDDDNSATNIENYTILDDKDNKVLINEIEEKDSKTFKVLLGKALSANKSYTIKITSIQDTNKYANTMYDYNGNITVGVVGAPKVESHSQKDYKDEANDEYVNEITILFSRAMDLATIVDPANYIVEIDGVIKPLADVNGYVDVIKSDGSLIKIFIRTDDYKKAKTVTKIAVLGVEDTNGKKLEDYGEMKDLAKKNTLKVDKYTSGKNDGEYKVVAVGAKKIEITFTDQVKKAHKSIFKAGDIEVVDVEGLNSKTLTLILDEKLDPNVGVELKIDTSDEEVISSLDQVFALESEYDIIDKIAPNFDKAVAKAVYDKVDITLEFDEDIVIVGDLLEAATRDITVVRVKGEAKKQFELNTVASDPKKLVLTITNETVDSDYTVSIKKNSDWLQDKDGNSVVEKTRRTTKAVGVEAYNAVVKAEATKANEEAEEDQFEKDFDAAQDLVDALASGELKTDLQERLNAIKVETPEEE